MSSSLVNPIVSFDTLCYMMVCLPLISAIYIGTLGRLMHKKLAGIQTCLFMGVATLASWWVGMEFYTKEVIFHQLHLWRWIQIDSLDIVFAISLDMLTLLMIVVVNTISLLVHIYSLGYMHRDATLQKFMAYLGLFTFFMLMLVTAPNFIQLFLGWEGVGLCSYLLIGYWYHKDVANNAAIKAFVTNRVGDLALVLGMAGCYYVFETLDFKTIFAAVPFATTATTTFLHQPISVLTGITLLIFIGAMGKSAQFGLHIWLPDAMEGPTPVSALIHAATMVAAGVYLLVRLSPLFEVAPLTLEIVAIVGLLTAFFGASVAIVQNDIKKIIAYSTCSHLGYMFFAIGLGGYGIAMFHLVTHACFKALLFLGAGSVIHAMSDEQDIRHMGGLWRRIPLTYGLMWIGTLTLMGIPFFSGYYSKEAILGLAWATDSTVASWVYYGGVACAGLSALYSIRLMMLTFHGTTKANDSIVAHIHESPMVMVAPLFILAVGSVVIGALMHNDFVTNAHDFWGSTLLWVQQISRMHQAEEASLLQHMVPVIVAVLGGVLGWVLYSFCALWPSKIRTHFQEIYQFLYAKWYIDELYAAFIYQPYTFLSEGLSLWIEHRFINDTFVLGLGRFSQTVGQYMVRLQTGYITQYIAAALVGSALLAVYMWSLTA